MIQRCRRDFPRRIAMATQLCALIVSTSSVMAQEPLTLSIEPWGETVAMGGQLVQIEVFVTAHEEVRISGGGHDLVCSLPARPGSLGSVTAIGGSVDPQGDGTNGPSGNGIAYVLGQSGFGLFAPTMCSFTHLVADPAPRPHLFPGDVRYLGTHYVEVSDCAVGEFDVLLESYSNPPSQNDTTYFYGIYSLGDPIVRFPLSVVNAVLTIPGGTCCDGSICLADNMNEHCCLSTYSGARWFEGRSCADPLPCPDCEQDAECDDGVACTGDSCNSLTGRCDYVAIQGECDDSLFCNGVETCDSALGCLAGENPCVGTVTIEGATVFLECDENSDACVVPPIPTVSAWGITTLALLVLTAAKLSWKHGVTEGKDVP